MLREIDVVIDDAGAMASWWTEEIADLLCSLCSDSLCSGWKENKECHVANRWCG